MESGRIREVSERPIAVRDARVIDVGGRTLMPGLIDAHIHAYWCDVDWQESMRQARLIGRLMPLACWGLR